MVWYLKDRCVDL